MEVLIYNFYWMSFNIFLAFVAVLFGIFMVRSKHTWVRAFNTLLWLLFIPNTIYLFTDIIHVPQQWDKLSSILRILLLAQYSLLVLVGAFTFVLAMQLFEKTYFKKKKIKHEYALLVGTNFLIGFGLVLGRIQRTNSWEVFTNIPRVLSDAVGIAKSADLILLTIFFGVLCNSTYFTLSKIKFFK